MNKNDQNVTQIEKHTILLERVLPVSAEILWKAIGTQEGLRNWFMPTPHQLSEGGTFSFEGGWDGKVGEILQGRSITFIPDGAGDAFLRFEMDSAEKESRFRLVDKMNATLNAAAVFTTSTSAEAHQPGGIGTHWAGIIAGYHLFIDDLENYLTGSSTEADYGELCQHYANLLDQWHTAGDGGHVARRI